MRSATLATLCLACSVGACLVLGAEPTDMSSVRSTEATAVSWDNVRASIMSAICLVEDQSQPEGYRIVLGDRAACGSNATNAVDEAVGLAFKEVQPLFATIAPRYFFVPDGMSDVYKLPTDEMRRHATGERVLSDGRFTRAFLPQLDRVLKAAGMVCTGCPGVVNQELRVVSWKELAPYVIGFVSAAVRTGEDGKLKPAFRICSGTEVAARIPDANIDLVHAGFFLAYKSPTMRQVALDELKSAIMDASFRERGTDAERTEYLQLRLAERLRSDGRVVEGLCAVLSEYQASVGLDVPECRMSQAPR